MRPHVCLMIFVIFSNVIRSTAAEQPAVTPSAANLDKGLIQRELASVYLTTAPQLNKNHQQSEIIQRLQPLAIRQAGYLASLVHSAPGRDGALSITSSKSDEHSIRPNARTLNGLAVMASALPDEAFSTTLTRQMCRDRAVDLLKFVLPTHGAGGMACSDGEQWKNQWQSALWANSAGIGAWLLWDDLSPELKWLAARMICDEANRFVGKTPPAQVLDDTKAEENAWNSTVISLAACMFPHHPNHMVWRDTAATWALSSFVRKADIESASPIDGATLSQRGLGPTLHDDYTMENHRRVHPDYMNTINMCLEQWAPYAWAGLSQPEALRFNTREVYKTLRTFTFPDAGYVYVSGQDWQLHRNPQWLHTYALQAIFFDDPEAALLTRRALEVNELMMARSPEGGVFLPEEFSFASAQADTLEMYMQVYLTVLAYGDGAKPVDELTYWKSLAGVHLFEAGKLAVVRTDKSVATFCWGNQPMGMVLPISKDLLISPNERNLIGSISCKGIKDDKPEVLQASPQVIKGHFAVTGILSRAGGAIQQRFAFVALKDGRVIYLDDLVVKKPVEDLTINLGTISVLNDRNWIYHDGTRELYWAENQHDNQQKQLIFNVHDAGNEHDSFLNSRWYNLENNLGIVIAAADGSQRYVNNKRITNGRLEQPFHLMSLQNTTSTLEPSDTPLTSQTLVFYPGQFSTETALVADEIQCSWSRPGLCQLTMSGISLEADLNNTDKSEGLRINSWPITENAPQPAANVEAGR